MSTLVQCPCCGELVDPDDLALMNHKLTTPDPLASVRRMFDRNFYFSSEERHTVKRHYHAGKEMSQHKPL